MRRTILMAVGLNPYRKHKVRPADYAMLAAASVVAIALVLWGLFS